MTAVTNSINRGSGAHRDEGEARSIGSSKYKNLKLGREEDEDQEAAIYTSSHHMLSLSRPPPHGGRHGSARTRAVTRDEEKIQCARSSSERRTNMGTKSSRRATLSPRTIETPWNWTPRRCERSQRKTKHSSVGRIGVLNVENKGT